MRFGRRHLLWPLFAMVRSIQAILSLNPSALHWTVVVITSEIESSFTDCLSWALLHLVRSRLVCNVSFSRVSRVCLLRFSKPISHPMFLSGSGYSSYLGPRAICWTYCNFRMKCNAFISLAKHLIHILFRTMHTKEGASPPCEWKYY